MKTFRLKPCGDVLFPGRCVYGELGPQMWVYTPSPSGPHRAVNASLNGKFLRSGIALKSHSSLGGKPRQQVVLILSSCWLCEAGTVPSSVWQMRKPGLRKLRDLLKPTGSMYNNWNIAPEIWPQALSVVVQNVVLNPGQSLGLLSLGWSLGYPHQRTQRHLGTAGGMRGDCRQGSWCYNRFWSLCVQTFVFHLFVFHFRALIVRTR